MRPINPARNFRMTREEAARLNITDSLQIQPTNEFGGMLAVMHNLHCLVSLCLPFCIHNFFSLVSSCILRILR